MDHNLKYILVFGALNAGVGMGVAGISVTLWRSWLWLVQKNKILKVYPERERSIKGFFPKKSMTFKSAGILIEHNKNSWW